ncbi:hypothetical protein CONCODRAFT_1910 [Conidiobolus coronatus NRRL 28638]|uniref:Uncharacterized protein n=1 Tax=Conidiobolus coronatus (strain ATCC 28846 / CBS 209.66 / NRRL 28638) TaxID=796925 RepID=A0A137PIN4_CONC2|nr:hypothetical protein CONCODRAFT_1910 [Conidiobolus coronatus NRRL 28638]|eukprot:KXN74845.1 hypothetical protein CONCODRAFT_1910 [Conidiobolus coronatus NRRL 28638]
MKSTLQLPNLPNEKNEQKAINLKTGSNGPIREVWANPDIDNTNNIITFDKTNCSNTIYSNGSY